VTVLIADDNVDAAQTLATVLEMVGYQVHVVYDGGAAVEAARTLALQAIICDIGMPVLDGYDVARRIRTRPAGPGELVMIACTGYGTEADRQNALAAGFDHHVTKPVQIPDLLRLLPAPDGKATVQG
jgi:CheY-like chemotaxis protein